MSQTLDGRLPLIAILRGLEAERAAEIANVLIDAGFEFIEVPLNSPQPFDSIATLVAIAEGRALVGAGTVLEIEQVDHLADIGAQLAVSPNCNINIVARAVDRGMIALPGVLSPTEMFAALEAGAAGLKIFPAELVPPSGIKAARAVLPQDMPIFAVGGIHEGNMADYLEAGATGFGIGGSIFKPGKSTAEIAADARNIVAAFHAARAN